MYLTEHFTLLDIKMKIIKLEAKKFFKNEFLEFKMKLRFFWDKSHQLFGYDVHNGIV